MKIGMNMLYWTTHVSEEHFPLIDRLKETGYDGIEVSIGEGNVHHYVQLGRHLSSLELGRTAVTSLQEETNIASPDPAIRQAGLDRLKWAIDRAQALGARLLCGPFHSAFAYFSNQPPTETERKWSIEMLSRAGEFAQEAGITLAPEAINRFECYLCNTMAQLGSILDEVNHPDVGAMFDTHHAHIEEKSQGEAIRLISPHLKHVHISENDRGTPGKGQVNWDEVFSTLKNLGYDGWLTLEAFSTEAPDFANSINVWRNYSPAKEVYEEGFKFIQAIWEEV